MVKSNKKNIKEGLASNLPPQDDPELDLPGGEAEAWLQSRMLTPGEAKELAEERWEVVSDHFADGPAQLLLFFFRTIIGSGMKDESTIDQFRRRREVINIQFKDEGYEIAGENIRILSQQMKRDLKGVLENKKAMHNWYQTGIWAARASATEDQIYDFLDKVWPSFEDDLNDLIVKNIVDGKIRIAIPGEKGEEEADFVMKDEPLRALGREEEVGEFSLKIPGPGFDEPVGNPEGKTRARFITTDKPKYKGLSGGKFRVYKQRLMDLGIFSFDEFYQQIIDCFGRDKWLDQVLEEYGMDYVFRDEHERAFVLLDKNQGSCPAESGEAPDLTITDEEPEEAASELEEGEFPPGSILSSRPRHASCVIEVRKNLLTYGDQDPLGLYEKPIKMSLDEAINEIFGYAGGWKEYKEKNHDDIFKQTIVQRTDGERISFDKPQNYRYQQGDRVVQAPTFWPFHVYFAFREFRENYAKDILENKDYKLILFQQNEEQISFYKKLPSLFYSWVLKQLNPAAKLLEKAEGRYQRQISNLFKKSNWKSFTEDFRTLTEDDEEYSVLSRRLGIFGIQKKWDSDEPGSDASPFVEAIMEPPEKIENKELIQKLLQESYGEMGHGAVIKNQPLYTPGGKQIFVDGRPTDEVEGFEDGGGEHPPGVGTESPMVPESITLQGTTPLVAHSWAPLSGLWKTLGETPKIAMFLGNIVILPATEGAHLTPAEEVLCRRMGVNPDSPLKYDIFTNSFNTTSGKALGEIEKQKSNR